MKNNNNIIQGLKNLDTGSLTVLLVRIIVGTVFLSEGIQKFVFPEIRGVGRFIKIGFPVPEFLGYFVASFEVFCGALVLIGLFSRYAAFPLIIIMLTAIVSTKIPIFVNEGFWEMAHAARTDWAMLLSSIILLISRNTKYSMEGYILKRTNIN